MRKNELKKILRLNRWQTELIRNVNTADKTHKIYVAIRIHVDMESEHFGTELYEVDQTISRRENASNGTHVELILASCLVADTFMGEKVQSNV